MWRSIVNFFSYLWFVLSLDWLQLLSTVIDIFILVWSIINWNEWTGQPTFVLVFSGVFIGLIWQLLNVAGHFTFLKKEDPRNPLMSMLKRGTDSKDFSLIHTDHELLEKEKLPYVINNEYGVLENPEIIELLLDNSIKINPILENSKWLETRTYIRQYKDTLLKFLNHRWYEINQKRGQFTNDRKVCFASEPFPSENGTFEWRVCKGRYYYGYLTNFIYTQYVGGSFYKLYPPMNMNTDPIKSLGGSNFSDHIGVSTLLYTSDGYIFVLRQAANAGYNANCYMPTGSGSMDYTDFKKGEDLRQMVIRGAERELAEEASMKKTMRQEIFKDLIETTVIGYYRDMERGGKPEFCCVSRIRKTMEDVRKYVHASEKETAKKSEEAILFKDKKTWNNFKSEASLSLKMNYIYLEKYLGVKDGW